MDNERTVFLPLESIIEFTEIILIRYSKRMPSYVFRVFFGREHVKHEISGTFLRQPYHNHLLIKTEIFSK